ncbi:MAG: TerD family protein [Oscillospiraceae bacterium]|nr:TerD family protein [Oscillospiraceae bacterium]
MRKFLKAHCRKTDRWYGLEIEQFGSTWKVVNMIDLSDDEAAVLSSEIRQPSFETNSNLLACTQCGSRRVGGCSCAKKKYSCQKHMKYRFDCIYCSELEIDYSLPTGSEVSGRAGETVVLSQGQEVTIRYADDRPLSKIIVGVGWDPAVSGINIDVDSSVFVQSGQGWMGEMVYFGDKVHPSGCVVHHGDNLTGDDIPNAADDENISVYLDKVPSNRSRLVFVLNIYRCADRNQTFGGIRNLYIRLYDPDSRKALIEYPVTGNFSRDTALIVGMAYRKGGGWVFRAIGKGSRARDLYQLSEECQSL